MDVAGMFHRQRQYDRPVQETSSALLRLDLSHFAP